MEVYKGIWNLVGASPNMAVETAIDESNGSFHFQVPSTSMEASTNFHESKCTSIYFHGSKAISNLLPWKLAEASM